MVFSRRPRRGVANAFLEESQNGNELAETAPSMRREASESSPTFPTPQNRQTTNYTPGRSSAMPNQGQMHTPLKDLPGR